MGIGMARLERHVYDPKLGIPAAVLLYQAKVPSYLDMPAEISWRAVEKPDPQNPVGVKGVGEPPHGFGRVRDHHGDRRCAGGTPVQPHTGFDRHDPECSCRGARRRTSRFKSTRSEGASP